MRRARSERLSAKLFAKLPCDIRSLIKMRIDLQCSLERLQCRLQIAAPHIQHAKTAERAKVPWLEIDHAGNVTARASILAKEKPHRRALVPCLGKIRMVIDELAEDLFGTIKNPPVHQRHTALHQPVRIGIPVGRYPARPYFSGQLFGLGMAVCLRKVGEEPIQSRVGLVTAGRHRPHQACQP